MTEQNGEMSNNGEFFNQLCWSCKRATHGCPWADRGHRINGWDATPCEVNAGWKKDYKHRIQTYEIHSCPGYSADSNRDGSQWIHDPAVIREHINRRGQQDVTPLLEAIVQKAREDLVRSAQKIQLMRFKNSAEVAPTIRLYFDCEKYFLGRWFGRTTGFDGKNTLRSIFNAYNLDADKINKNIDRLQLIADGRSII